MDKDYYAYLTLRLDKGISKNPVVKEVEKLIQKILKRRAIIHVADIGCFSGSLIDRIYKNLPIRLRKRVRLTGVDNKKESLVKGRENYPEITFMIGDLSKGVLLIEQYDIAILSNILHEVYSEKIQKKLTPLTAAKAVKSAVHRVVSLLNRDGYLVILEGIKPSFPSKDIIIEFATSLVLEKFFKFAKKYKIAPIKIEKLLDKKIKTNLGSLAAFLTKARYLNESYWKQESLELYQFFTAEDFKRIFRGEKMKIVKFELQKFSRTEIRKQIKSIKPDVQIPAKNALIVAKKL